MGIFSLTNVPAARDSREIKGVVEGPNIYIVAAEKGSKWRDGNSVQMVMTQIGDHLLDKPDVLKQMYADDIANAIRLGRDAGYQQALREVRDTLGIRE